MHVRAGTALSLLLAINVLLIVPINAQLVQLNAQFTAQSAMANAQFAQQTALLYKYAESVEAFSRQASVLQGKVSILEQQAGKR